MSNAEKPRRTPGIFCPLWRRDVSKVCHTCEWYVHIRGKHPQSEEEIDHWGCSIAWMPVLAIENSQQQRQTGASCDKVANEVRNFHENMHHFNQKTQQIMLRAVNPVKQIAGD